MVGLGSPNIRLRFTVSTLVLAQVMTEEMAINAFGLNDGDSQASDNTLYEIDVKKSFGSRYGNILLTLGCPHGLVQVSQKIVYDYVRV